MVTPVAPHIFKTYFEWDLTIYAGFLFALGLWVGELLRTQRLKFLVVPVLLIGAVSFADLFAFQEYSSEGVLTRTRNFFGTLLVRDVDPGTPGERMIFKHGAITYGIQYVPEKRRGEGVTPMLGPWARRSLPFTSSRTGREEQTAVTACAGRSLVQAFLSPRSSGD